MSNFEHGVGSTPHVVLFPFMSKGHTIPLLHLAHLLLRRGATVTVFTTPANRAFISKSLSSTTASIITLPFPENIHGIPAGIESTDKLPSMSLFMQFATSTKLMKADFEKAISTLLPRVTFMVSDGFLGWTLDSTSKFGIPRLAFFGFNNCASTITSDVIQHGILLKKELDDDEQFQVPCFPWIKLTKKDFSKSLQDHEGPHADFNRELLRTTSNSYGLLVNSVYELESKFVEFSNREWHPKAWCVGPLCMAGPSSSTVGEAYWWKFLEGKTSVLYVAFGSQAEISREQIVEIKAGLEKSGVDFVWVVGKSKDGLSLNDGFEERVKGRGIVVSEWVEQREILGHASVRGFLSHCGWNSTLESICAKVPILAWPMMAEQPLNAWLVVEDLKVGLRVGRTVGELVKGEDLEKSVLELMEGEMGKVVRDKVAEVGELVVKAVEEGGSSWRSLNDLMEKIDPINCKKT